MLKSMQGKDDFKATLPFFRPYNYQAIAYGIGFKQRKIFNYLLKRWYYEFWIDCRLCEMIAHGSSTVIIFSSEGFAAKNQKVQATPFVC